MKQRRMASGGVKSSDTVGENMATEPIAPGAMSRIAKDKKAALLSREEWAALSGLLKKVGTKFVEYPVRDSSGTIGGRVTVNGFKVFVE